MLLRERARAGASFRLGRSLRELREEDDHQRGMRMKECCNWRELAHGEVLVQKDPVPDPKCRDAGRKYRDGSFHEGLPSANGETLRPPTAPDKPYGVSVK